MTSTEINLALNFIQDHLKNHPEDSTIISTEFAYIINKYDPDIKNGTKEKLPLVNSDFLEKTVIITNKIIELIGDFKIPDLRFAADKLSKQLNIPFPSATRKNRESLLQWYYIHWDLIKPHINNIIKEKKI